MATKTKKSNKKATAKAAPATKATATKPVKKEDISALAMSLAAALMKVGVKFYHAKPRVDFSSPTAITPHRKGVRFTGGQVKGYLMLVGKNAGKVCTAEPVAGLKSYASGSPWPKLNQGYLVPDVKDIPVFVKAIA